MAEDSLGVAFPPMLAVRLNALNFALRLCPDGERAALRQRAAITARALESVPYPIGHMQRAFYFEITGDEHAEMDEWQKTVRLSPGGGLFAAYYCHMTPDHAGIPSPRR